MKLPYVAVTFLSVGSLLVAMGGCAPAAPARSGIPSNSMQVSSGSKVVAFTAPQDGKAYLNDDTTRRVVYSTELKKGQVMRYDPSVGAVRIDGNTAPEGIPDSHHEHSIYFTPTPMSERTNRSESAPQSGTNTIPTVRVPIGVQVDVQPQQNNMTGAPTTQR